jgi:NADP-dependent 3-hydroxy acid dehydrogenase YdfG
MEAWMSGMERWQGKVALITGASSGIGEAVARRLGRSGLKIAVCARRKDRLDALATELASAGVDVLAHATDLRDPASIDGLFQAIRAQWGGVDVLINNAGMGKKSSLMAGDTEAWREMLEVNVLALCVCTREAITDMRARGDDGHVIHIGSMAGHRVPPGSGVYSASKYAVRSLTEGLRQELREAKSRIRVTAVSPGFVETEFHGVYLGDEEKGRATYSHFKVLEADDVAAGVQYALEQPVHAQIHDILMRPTDQGA